MWEEDFEDPLPAWGVEGHGAEHGEGEGSEGQGFGGSPDDSPCYEDPGCENNIARSSSQRLIVL